MNLTMTTRWSKDHHTYLIVTVSAANDDIEAIASQTYLDIQMPEGVRVRHIGNLSSDGHGKNIGVDLPDLAAGMQQDIVFKVKSRDKSGNPIAPELHLHWIDSASGDLLERHQTGTPMPTEPTETDDDLVRIVADAKTNRKRTNSHRRQTAMLTDESIKENELMNTERHPRRSRHHGHSRRHEHHEARMAGHMFGRHNYSALNRDFDEASETSRNDFGHHGRRPGKGHLIRTLRHMQDRMNDMERRMRRMQREAQFRATTQNDESETHQTRREIIRTRRPAHHHGCIPARHRHGRRVHAEGRKMGRMAHRTWRDRQPEA